MRAVVQRVTSASVKVEGETISQIGRGLLCLIGLTATDTEKDMDYLVNKITKLRFWPGAKASAPTAASAPSSPAEELVPWQQNVVDMKAEILCVSQFTLYAVTTKGNKPDFHQAMPAAQAKEAYTRFLQKLRAVYPNVQDGQFQAMMEVGLVNDGPITITIESPSKLTPS